MDDAAELRERERAFCKAYEEIYIALSEAKINLNRPVKAHEDLSAKTQSFLDRACDLRRCYGLRLEASEGDRDSSPKREIETHAYCGRVVYPGLTFRPSVHREEPQVVSNVVLGEPGYKSIDQTFSNGRRVAQIGTVK